MRVEIDLDEDERGEHSASKLLHRVLALLKHHEHKQNERHQEIMTALERLTASVTTTGTNVASLTAAVDDAVSHIGNPGATDAQLNTLADSIDALNGTIAAQTTRLQTAVNPPPPPPPAP